MSKQLQLTIDTSFFSARVALLLEGAVLSSSSKEGFGSAEVLNTLVKNVLTEQKKELSQLTQIFVIIGPGSFTGLRVGVAAAQAYSLALGIPLTACTSLFALANSIDLKNSENQKISLQASANDFFVSHFNFDDSGVALPSSGVSLGSGDLPKYHFKNGLSSEVKDIKWAKVLKALSLCSDISSGCLSEHIQRGAQIEIVYGKGTSAKTLAERGIKNHF